MGPYRSRPDHPDGILAAKTRSDVDIRPENLTWRGSRMRNRGERPDKATHKRRWKAECRMQNDRGQDPREANPLPPQSHPKATPKPHQSHLKATHGGSHPEPPPDQVFAAKDPDGRGERNIGSVRQTRRPFAFAERD